MDLLLSSPRGSLYRVSPRLVPVSLLLPPLPPLRLSLSPFLPLSSPSVRPSVHPSVSLSTKEVRKAEALLMFSTS